MQIWLEIKFNSFFSVYKIESKEGDNVTISWTAPFFPSAGTYEIYHTNKVTRSIITVKSDNVTFQPNKYEYLSQPLTSVDVTFMIRDITLADAGYYAGGIKEDDASSGGGVVLIFLG